ncbi:MAG: M91 family zinc metallopeptidase [Proteobacteria bacterium]|nr:M91 family zinc metallopeptidase [Pseudomonadota bacterium]
MPTVLIGGPAFSARSITTSVHSRFGLPPWETWINYGDGIEIRPDPADPTFQSRALAALIRLDTTPTMHSAFDAIDASGHSVTLENFHPGPGEGPYNASCSSHDKGRFIPGKGADSTVNWNPDINGFDPPGTTPNWQQPGADVILGHEMIHATHNAEGTNANNRQNRSAVDEERNTVGLPAQTYNWPGDPAGYNGTALPDTTGGTYTENKLRQDYNNRESKEITAELEFPLIPGNLPPSQEVGEMLCDRVTLIYGMIPASAVPDAVEEDIAGKKLWRLPMEAYEYQQELRVDAKVSNVRVLVNK